MPENKCKNCTNCTYVTTARKIEVIHTDGNFTYETFDGGFCKITGVHMSDVVRCPYYQKARP